MGFVQQGGGSFGGTDSDIPRLPPPDTDYPDLISNEDCYLDYKKNGQIQVGVNLIIDTATGQVDSTAMFVAKYNYRVRKSCRPKGLSKNEDAIIQFKQTRPFDENGRRLGKKGDTSVFVGPAEPGPQPPGQQSTKIRVAVAFILAFSVVGNNCRCKVCQDIILIDTEGNEVVVDADCELPESAWDPGVDMQSQKRKKKTSNYLNAPLAMPRYANPTMWPVRDDGNGGFEMCVNSDAGAGYNSLINMALDHFANVIDDGETCDCNLNGLRSPRWKDDLRRKVLESIENTPGQNPYGGPRCGVWGDDAPI